MTTEHAWTAVPSGNRNVAGSAGKPLTDQIGGTQRLDSALTRAGIEHTTNYLDRGLHGWSMFSGQLAPAWAAIRPALY
ncbi:hypothetical protein NQ023_00685 [Corynebacterium phoceense]|uniref:hypothetical protein n=1 Tax=Corynebacterium TaxID=1716 RepID=UPI00079749C5|nr:MULTISPECIES: hypothetical protein [Corynebacterium]OFP19519.1 hypothetical protein HMPREF2998_09330 [Corynebacterium sp. HMSC065A05]KXB53074.1 hypothetical protein HMPREF0307_01992 [Corynebacterium sp. DNF00584]MBF9010732.1 hypothetical protein [Corynebacterium phoceense]MCQ9340338.1 hypothetical protein [Corynebacterium phoceense]MCQ9346988.1 hypothetical protein [Corynebacterium phoceense]